MMAERDEQIRVATWRKAIGWLRARAETMNDPRARLILNSAAHDMGNESRGGRIAAAPTVQETKL